MYFSKLLCMSILKIKKDLFQNKIVFKTNVEYLIIFLRAILNFLNYII